MTYPEPPTEPDPERPHYEWEMCPECDGDEGHFEGDEWVDCDYCEGMGGWHR